MLHIGRRRANVLDLRSVTTTGDTDTDVQLGELIEADDEERLVDLSYGKKTASASLCPS